MSTPFIIPTPSASPYLSTDINVGQLPPLLEQAMTVADEPAQQDMLLISTLTACSFAMPNIKILHGGKAQHTYYPNLLSLIIAPSATGKGLMNNAHLLIEPIHRILLTQDKQARIPANSSSAAFTDLLHQNDGCGFIIETEMDILSKIWKKDFGDYSDLFRQAFEHELYTKARRAPGNKHTVPIEIPHPRLSVLLSGTPNQVKPLIGSGEDGLASRFLTYIVSDIPPFDRNVLLCGDHYEENAAQKVFEQLGEQLKQRYLWLAAQDHECLWSFTDEQAQAFGDVLEDYAHLAFEKRIHPETGKLLSSLPATYTSAFNRMVVTIKRIGAILSVLRLPIDSSDHAATLPQVLYCSDEDFKTLVLFTEKFLRHAAELYRMLPEVNTPLPVTRVEKTADKRAEDLLSLLPDTFTTTQALQIAQEWNVNEKTIYRYLQQLQQLKSIVKLSRGKYKKI